MLTVGQPEDPVNDATLPWPDDRRTVDAGMLTLTGVETEEPGNARDVNFDPLVLPDGIEPSDDPLADCAIIRVRGVLSGPHRRTEIPVGCAGR